MVKRLVVSVSLLSKSMIDTYTRSDGAVVNAHDSGKNAAAPKAPGIGQHAAALKASSKEGSMDHWSNQAAATHMAAGDSSALKNHLQGADTAARDHILEHVHPDHHAGLGFPTLNHARSVKKYGEKFPDKPAKTAKPAAAAKAPKRSWADLGTAMNTAKSNYQKHKFDDVPNTLYSDQIDSLSEEMEAHPDHPSNKKKALANKPDDKAAPKAASDDYANFGDKQAAGHKKALQAATRAKGLSEIAGYRPTPENHANAAKAHDRVSKMASKLADNMHANPDLGTPEDYQQFKVGAKTHTAKAAFHKTQASTGR